MFNAFITFTLVGALVLWALGSAAAQSRYGDNYHGSVESGQRQGHDTCGATCGWAIDSAASFVLPRGVPTLTTPLTGAEPQQIKDGVEGFYRQGRTGTNNKSEADALKQLEKEEQRSYGTGAKRAP